MRGYLQSRLKEALFVASMQVPHHVIELVELTLNRRVVEELRRDTVARGQDIASDSVANAHGASANASMLVYAEGAYPVFKAKGSSGVQPGFDLFLLAFRQLFCQLVPAPQAKAIGQDHGHEVTEAVGPVVGHHPGGFRGRGVLTPRLQRPNLWKRLLPSCSELEDLGQGAALIIESRLWDDGLPHLAQADY